MHWPKRLIIVLKLTLLLESSPLLSSCWLPLLAIAVDGSIALRKYPWKFWPHFHDSLCALVLMYWKSTWSRSSIIFLPLPTIANFYSAINGSMVIMWREVNGRSCKYLAFTQAAYEGGQLYELVDTRHSQGENKSWMMTPKGEIALPASCTSYQKWNNDET